jgi:polar amino acid transport system permease protein
MFRFDTVLKDLPFLLRGAQATIFVSFFALIIGMVIGLIIALLRISRLRALSFAASFFVDVLRSTPLLVQLMWIFFALPILTGVALSPIAAGVIGLGLYAGAYLSEVYRSGILSIPQGQWHASMALGMTTNQLLWRVILPQALVRVLPPMASLWISMLKESALVSAVSVEELLYRGASLAAFTLRPVESFTATAALYFAITYPFAIMANILHRRYMAH